MKFSIILVVLTCVAWQAAAAPQDDSEPRAAPPRGLLKRGLLNKAKTTTTTTAAPLEDDEYVDESEYPQDSDAQEPSTEAPPSSTEGKKLVAGGVRPFRSNTDLLEALKRRRAQAAEAKLGHSSAPVREESAATEAPVKAIISKDKKRFSAKESNNEEVVVPAKPSRGRFGRPAVRSIQEPEKEEQQVIDTAPAGRSGRTFRRGGF